MSTSDALKSVNYDMRTLASDLSGSLEMLRDLKLDKNQSDLAGQASQSADALLNLVNLVIDYDAVKEGQFRLNNAQFDLASLVEQTAEKLRSLARANRVSLMTYILPDVPLRLSGDAGRLMQALTFVISRAIIRAPGSDVILRVTSNRGAQSPNNSQSEAALRFNLDQTAPKQANQTLPSDTPKSKENFLEEAVVAEIARQMRGELKINSSSEGDDSIWLTSFFEVPAAATAAATIDTEMGADDSFLINARVLVVDDSKANQDVLYYYMRSWGLKISRDDCVSSGQEALAALRRAASVNLPYDVAILDLSMPEINGIELARLIRNDPAVSDISLVLLTAFDYEFEREKAIKADFSSFLTKPVRQSQLLDAIASAAYERRIPQTAHQPASPPPAAEKENPASRQRVLIVEDNLANQKLALAQLDRLGYAASAVNNGASAIEEFKKNGHLYSLILMDCQMPVMDGFVAARGIRQQEAILGGHIPIIAMTATVTRGAREMCLEAGMDDYLSKPVSRDALHNMLLQWITG